MRAGQLSKVALLFFVAAFGVSCAPPRYKGTTQDPAKFLGGSAALASDADWRCPTSPNVLNTSDFEFEGAGDFTVCVGRDDAGRLKIAGSTRAENLCAYPMRKSSTSGLQLLEEPKCFSVTEGPAEITFRTKEANTLILVDYNVAGQMTACLSSPTPCPTHSVGLIQ